MNRPHGHSAVGKIKSFEKSNSPIGNWVRDLQLCSIAPQSTTLPFSHSYSLSLYIYIHTHTHTHTRTHTRTRAHTHTLDNADSSSEGVASEGRMGREWRIGKNVDGSGRGGPSQNCPGLRNFKMIWVRIVGLHDEVWIPDLVLSPTRPQHYVVFE
jgi:hypothetical protein